MNRRIKIGVVGGGAAGMAAAITAARRGAEVTILEGGERLGRKILSTGNGKCNLGNRNLSVQDYYTSYPKRMESWLNTISTTDVIDFFRELGLLIKEKNGYLYPLSEQASSVLDVLRFGVKELGVEIVTECKIRYIRKENGGIRIESADRSYLFDKVILACGGKAAPKTGSDGSGFKLAKQIGHSIAPTVPALVQLQCEEEYFKAVAGVRTEAMITIRSGGANLCERGELQLTQQGISGIPVFQLSRNVNYLLREKERVEAVIDLLPDLSREEWERIMMSRSILLRGRTLEEYFTGILNKKLMLLFIKLAGLKATDAADNTSREALSRVFSYCKEWRVHIIGSNSYESAQVTAGGVRLEEISDTFESGKMQGVYLIGEMLDVDGRCGGYNLHWAWCSGIIAGRAVTDTER